jgi:hypothetical protein
MHKANPDDRIALSRRLRYRAVEAEGVLVHLDSGRVIVVNEVGLFIIEQLSKPMTRRGLVTAICGEFEVEAPEAERDLRRYLDELAAEQVLETPTDAMGT